MITVTEQHDDGFSLIELLLVIVVMGILATVVVAAVGGLRDDAEDVGCKSDAHILYTSTEAFFAQRGAPIIPADGSLDGYEKTLVAEGFLRAPSTFYDIDSAGQLVQVSGSLCTV